MQKRVVVLGATGSIGCSALDVAAALPDEIRLVGLAANSNWARLAEQARRFEVGAVAIADRSLYARLREACPARTRVLAGPEGLLELVGESDANFVLAAIVGAACVPATLEAVRRGIDVGLANKEALVVAGSLIMPLVHENGGALIPVDSEHSAVFQALQSGRRDEVRRVYLTASGGPFRNWPAERISEATLQDALKHPTWSMGPKITIDSASMMNKALEVIEATHLFQLKNDELEVLVHPESIVHSMVEFRDGSVIAQLGAPDMRTPIQYAMTYPRRLAGPSRALRWADVRSLNFEPPNFEKFPSLRMGFEAARRGGTCGAVLNAANEAAVERFRAGEIRFGGIATMTERVFSRHQWMERPTLADLMECDAWARQEVMACPTS